MTGFFSLSLSKAVIGRVACPDFALRMAWVLRRGGLQPTSQLGVAAIAERSVTGVLVPTEINGAVFFGGVRLRRKLGSLVRAVAKRLGFTLAAGTPVIDFSGFDGYGKRCFLRNIWLAHNFIFLNL